MATRDKINKHFDVMELFVIRLVLLTVLILEAYAFIVGHWRSGQPEQTVPETIALPGQSESSAEALVCYCCQRGATAASREVTVPAVPSAAPSQASRLDSSRRRLTTPALSSCSRCASRSGFVLRLRACLLVPARNRALGTRGRPAPLLHRACPPGRSRNGGGHLHR
jgi:hypothetical protein